ncbi:MAG: phycobiliprotein lyase [Oscillatoriales cyanobacterium RM1_1_9]|nr:phycobiliprotein lyase [Oscillatoriales cyanobacterium RM1_1_9]
MRTTHHLAFRRTEKGESQITVEPLSAADPKLAMICQMHDVDKALAIGGADVRWNGSMAWDRQEDENHAGSTVFALVPDSPDARSGKMLRERGYAEVVPVVGEFSMDSQNGLILTTEYETMSSLERFSFPDANLRMRTSTVKRFGGFSTATFCTEFRPDALLADSADEPVQYASLLGW